MTPTDLFDVVGRLLLVLLTLYGLAVLEMILAARMIRVPEEKTFATSGISSEENQLN